MLYVASKHTYVYTYMYVFYRDLNAWKWWFHCLLFCRWSLYTCGPTSPYIHATRHHYISWNADWLVLLLLPQNGATNCHLCSFWLIWLIYMRCRLYEIVESWLVWKLHFQKKFLFYQKKWTNSFEKNRNLFRKWGFQTSSKLYGIFFQTKWYSYG